MTTLKLSGDVIRDNIKVSTVKQKKDQYVIKSNIGVTSFRLKKIVTRDAEAEVRRHLRVHSTEQKPIRNQR